MSTPLEITYDTLSIGSYILDRVKGPFVPAFPVEKEVADAYVDFYNAKEIEERYGVGIFAIEAAVSPHYHLVFSPGQLEGIARIVTPEVVLADRRRDVNDPQICEHILRPYFDSGEVSNEKIRAAVSEACFSFTARWDDTVFAYVAQHLSEYHKYAAERYDKGYMRKDDRWKTRVLDKLQRIQNGTVDDDMCALVKRELELLFEKEKNPHRREDLGKEIINIVSSNYLKALDQEKYYAVIGDLDIPDAQRRVAVLHALYHPHDVNALKKLHAHFTDDSGESFISFLHDVLEEKGSNPGHDSATLAVWLRMDLLSESQKCSIARYVVALSSGAPRLTDDQLREFSELPPMGKKAASGNTRAGVYARSFLASLGYIDSRPFPPEDALPFPSRDVLDIIVEGFKDQYLSEILEMGFVDLDRGIELFAESKSVEGHTVDPQSISNALEGNGAQCFAALVALRASQKVVTQGTELSRN